LFAAAADDDDDGDDNDDDKSFAPSHCFLFLVASPENLFVRFIFSSPYV